MPEFDLDTALNRTLFKCPVCDSKLQVVRRYIEEDFADVNEQGEVEGPRQFEIGEYIGTHVLCSQRDDHELALSEEQTAALLDEFDNL